jgi:hypothetical protein
MLNATTGKWDTVVMTKDPVPGALNDAKILDRNTLELTPHCLNPGETFGISYLIKSASLEPTLAKLDDGNYYIGVSDLIIDKAGRVASYGSSFGESLSGDGPIPDEIDTTIANDIQRRISSQLIAGDIEFTSVKDAQGKAAPYFLDRQNKESMYKLSTDFTIKNHKITYSNNVPF